MSNDYNAFLMRLKEERIRLGLSQKDVGRLVRMTQNHYSKVENGKKRFTFYELRNLCATQVDLFYVFTGTRPCIKNIVLVEDYDQNLFCIKLLYNMAQWKKSKNSDKGYWENLCRKMQYIDYANNNIAVKDSVVRAARIYMDYTQKEMADILGIDVKKLRLLEIESLLPDSELMLRLYQNFGISPAVFLKDNRYLKSEISSLVENVSADERRRLLSCIEFVYSCE